MSPSPESRRTSFHRNRGIALITVLSMVVIVSLILVAFVAAMRLERAASYSYSQSISAEQVAQGALNLVVAELQNEMGKDALADLTYPGKPLHTNVTSTNIMPQLVGTNAAMPNLVKISGTAPPFTGLLTSGKLLATSVNTATPGKNGRYIDTNRWNLPQLGNFPGAASTPNWILLTRSGATNAASLGLGATGNTLNNPAPSNTNFVIGRFAYAIYDSGGLLDITRAGYPASLTATQIQQIKGTLAGVLVNQTNFSVTQNDLLNWRNAASSANANAYLGYVTNFLATNAPTAVYPGDNSFLSRLDLIKAAKDGIAGLTTNALPNLTTFSRDRNAPSWGPTFNAADLGGTNAATYAYKNNAGVSTTAPFSAANPNPNRFLPGARFSGPFTISDYAEDGLLEAYPVAAGDTVVQRRFPLSRLAWVGPDGPNGVSAAAIQACFGLIWGPSEEPSLAPGTSVWKYVGHTGTSEQSLIKTLDQVAAEGRIPNFFELLQAGILRGSLAVNGTPATSATATAQQNFPAFQIFRIGAAAIDQADADSFPTVIEYKQSGYSWLACGVESLPGIVAVSPQVGAPRSPAQSEGQTSATAAVYLSFNLWNPHQVMPASPPELRIRVRGSVGVYQPYGDDGVLPDNLGSNSEPGFLTDLDESIELSVAGRVGFATPSTILLTDVVNPGATGDAPPSDDAGVWVNALPLGLAEKSDVAALRLRDFPFNLGSQSVATVAQYESVRIHPSYDSTNPFNAVMEFKAPSGAWVPYQFATGINDPLTWFRSNAWQYYIVSSPQRRNAAPQPANNRFGNFIAYLGGAYPAALTYNATTGGLYRFGAGPLDAPPGTGTVFIRHNNSWDRSLLFGSNDPRSTRFNYWIFDRSGTGALAASANMNLWQSANIAAFAKGYGGDSGFVQNKPSIFGDNYFPAQLSRNNHGSADAITGTDNSVTRTGSGTETSYADNDGLRRIGDSGLFINPNGTTGNPFERAFDRPVVLNRPFQSVGELGLVFRDSPWKTADFFSGKSADSSLLDLFTIRGAKESVVAGKINLNTRNQQVLKALLSDTVVDPVTGTSLSSASAETLASSIIQFTTTNKLVNKSELTTLVSPYLNPNNGNTTSPNFGSNDDQNIKIRREAFVRALSDVTQTRTWNLMIDIIAQSGRYTPTATATDQFMVEGERRYWLHVAIDRFTGNILEQKLEVVTE